ncbi:MAG: InlB B-repeat-containing protein, partial [Candidatus Nanopelagicales bacterium]|nr:InlB B-repeat-containing protein [Candidatus Nanopelagicales bacterium]
GTATAGPEVGSVLPITVTGMAPGQSANLTVTTTRTGYADGTATVSGLALDAALTPEFGDTTQTADGFTVNVTNYDGAFTWPDPTVTEGGTATAGDLGDDGLPITVTGLPPGQSADLTVTTTRTGYHDGAATVTGTAITGAALNPSFDAPVSTADGFTVNVTNYNSDYTWPDPTVIEDGTATAGTADGSVLPITVTGLTPGQSADLTVTTTHTGYADGTATVTGSALPNRTVTFDAHGGTGSMETQTANVPTALTANTFIRTNYSFTGWNTAANGSGTAYANQAVYPFTADAILYAQWAGPCAVGGGAAGTCVVGDIGPGGGKVFYVKESNPTGSRYMEAAPQTWSGGSYDPATQWGCYGDDIAETSGTAIGTGEANTAAIVAGCATDGIAAKLAAGYAGGGKNDWFLPSKDELNQLYTQKAAVGGSLTGFYWSSSQYGAYYAWLQNFSDGKQYDSTYKSVNYHAVRPVRAF